MTTSNLKIERKPIAPTSLVRQLRKRAIKPRASNYRSLYGLESIDIQIETKNGKRRIVDSFVDAHLGNNELELLTGLSDLRSLKLFMIAIPPEGQFTDAGLTHLRHLRRLRELHLTGCCHISNTSLASIGLLNGLRTLAFDHMEQITDAGLVHLTELRRLQNLTLEQTSVTGFGLTQLAHLPGLRRLSLFASPIMDSSLKHIGLLPELRQLDLGGTISPITDSGLGSLAACSRLESLSLWYNPNLRGDFLKDLGCLPHLKELWLRWTPLEEKHLVHLAAFPKLSVLDLSHTRLTNRAVDYLLELPQLRSLHLSETRITGKALRRLVGLKKLKYVTVGDRVDPADIRFLRRGIPGLECE